MTSSPRSSDCRARSLGQSARSFTPSPLPWLTTVMPKGGRERKPVSWILHFAACGRIGRTSLTDQRLPVNSGREQRNVRNAETTLVDTDVLIDLARSVPRAVQFCRRAEMRGRL